MVSNVFGHEAMLYAGADEFVGLAVPFSGAALDAGDPALVLVDPSKEARLREHAGVDGRVDRVRRRAHRRPKPRPHHPDLARCSVDDHADHRALWGIGEPLWAERSTCEIVECQQHEARATSHWRTRRR